EPISLRSGPLRPPVVPIVWQRTQPLELKICAPFTASPLALSAAFPILRYRRKVMSCQTSRPFRLKPTIGVPATPLVMVRNSASSVPPCLNAPVERSGPAAAPDPSRPWHAAHCDLKDC